MQVLGAGLLGKDSDRETCLYLNRFLKNKMPTSRETRSHTLLVRQKMEMTGESIWDVLSILMLFLTILT